MKKITKRQALKEFKEVYQSCVPQDDKPALREAWNNYTDSLCKDNKISLKQYESWTNPF